jgi:hypothetical protein
MALRPPRGFWARGGGAQCDALALFAHKALGAGRREHHNQTKAAQNSFGDPGLSDKFWRLPGAAGRT